MEVHYREMNTRHGDLVYLDVCGQPMIILGTHEVAVDLLDKRASIYSDRQYSSMGDLTGFSWLLGTMPYGQKWRGVRKGFHQYMNPDAVKQYRSIQEREARKLLSRLLEDPKRFSEHGRYALGAAIIRITYGLKVADKNDKYLEIAEEALTGFNAAFVPGKYLVEMFPSMRYLPSWLPWAKFKREANGCRLAALKIRNVTWEDAIKAIRQGGAPPSMVAGLDGRVEDGEDQETAKDSAASVFLGGSDTMLSTVQTFFAAMAMNPDVQKLAQAELDSAVGPRRLPNLDDEPDLPYVNALIKECLRWRSVTPLGMAHKSMEENEYKGYRIPKGSIVVSNIWAYSRDSRFYSDPEEFRPERFLKDGRLNPDVLDPELIVFGYGRRICPGLHFAKTMLFTTISNVLHTFWVSPPVDEQGNSVPIKLRMTPGVISYAEPFECEIKPRSAEAERLVREAHQDAYQDEDTMYVPAL